MATEYEISHSIDEVLKQLRESFHRHGQLGQHELLDEVSKLLFAHLRDVQSGGHGVSPAIFKSDKMYARQLKAYTEDVIGRNIDFDSLKINTKEYSLLIGDQEDLLAREIVESFSPLTTNGALEKIRSSKSLDTINGVFGKYLADSFVDEKEMGQYLTPREVVSFMTQLGIGLLGEDRIQSMFSLESKTQKRYIVDPSCGVGSFLVEAIHQLYPRIFNESEENVEEWYESFVKENLLGFDKSKRMLKLATINLGLYGIPTANLSLVNSLSMYGKESEIPSSINGKVDLILTNPPFGAEIKGNDLDHYQIATKWSDGSLKSVASEILFLERYLEWLTPGGVLVSVVPDSILTNRGIFGRLRKGLAENIELISVTSLPRVAFAGAGTNTKTSVIALRKKNTMNVNQRVMFSICTDLGFEVYTRGSQKMKKAKGINQLPSLLDEIQGKSEKKNVIEREIDVANERWDATFHSTVSNEKQQKINELRLSGIDVSRVAELVNEKIHPKKLWSDTFSYIEISDARPGDIFVGSKSLSVEDAPSRARKRVRAGDVLVSTVRPDRRSAGIVPNELDGAICSTGFAVLRPTHIHPLVLLKILTTDFVNIQIMKHNSGIAYPVVSEECFMDILLPIKLSSLDDLAIEADRVLSAAQELEIKTVKYNQAIEHAMLA